MNALSQATTFVDYFDFPLDEEPEDENFGEPFMAVCAQLSDAWPTKRAAVDLSWNPDDLDVIAVAYNNHTLLTSEQYYDGCGFIWNIRDPSNPLMLLDGGAPITVLGYNPLAPATIAAGLMTGQVCIWDVREGQNPVWITERYYTFYDMPTCLQWTSPTLGNELTVASLDGQIHWYDIRQNKSPADAMIMDLTKGEYPKLERALGVCSYQFEASLPAKFLAGTTSGLVISGNRRGKNSEEKVGKNLFYAHQGPVLSLARNPQYLKFFFSIGDWLMKIWSEDYGEPVVWTNYGEALLTCCAWGPIKNSVLVMSRDDGVVELWDYLEKGTGPLITTQVTDVPIRKLEINDSGQFIAVVSDDGVLSVLNWSRHFGVSNYEDKFFTSAWLEREIRLEKQLELKNKELTLRKKALLAEKEFDPLPDMEKEGIWKADLHFGKTLRDTLRKRGKRIGLLGEYDDD